MKKLLLSTLLFIPLVFPHQLHSETNSEIVQNISLERYVSLALQASGELREAENKLQTAEADYTETKQSNKSPFDKAKASIYLEKIKRKKKEKRREIILKAVNNYFSLLQSQRDLNERDKQLSIAIEKEKIAKLRLEEGIEKEEEYIEQEENVTESRIMLIKAQNTYIKQLRIFLETIGMEYNKAIKIIPKKEDFFLQSEKFDFTECLKKAQQTNSNYIYTLKMYQLYKQRCITLSNTDITTPREKKHSKNIMESYRDNYLKAKKNLENRVWSLVTANNLSIEILKLKRIQAELAKKQLTIKKINLSEGTIFSTDLEEAKLNYTEAQNNLKEETEISFLNLLKLKAIMGEDVKKSIETLCRENPIYLEIRTNNLHLNTGTL